MADEVGIAGQGQAETPLPVPPAATLVLHFETARQRRWAIRTALELVKSLTARREKVVVADLQRREGLADALDVTPGPGIVDVLFRGTSFSVVAKRPEGEDYYFLTIGTNPPPVQVIYSHPQWKKIAARLPQANAHLLACVPWPEWMQAGPIPGFETCVLLNGVGSDMPSPEGARPIAEYVAPPEVRDPALATPIPGMESPDLEEEESVESDEVAGFMATGMEIAEAGAEADLSRADVAENLPGAEEIAEAKRETAAEPELQGGPEVGAASEPEAGIEEEKEIEPVVPEPWTEAASQVDDEPPRPTAPGLGRAVGGGQAMADRPESSTERLWPDSYSTRRRREGGLMAWVRRGWPILAAAAVLVAAFGLWQVLKPEAQSPDAAVSAAAESSEGTSRPASQGSESGSESVPTSPEDAGEEAEASSEEGTGDSDPATAETEPATTETEPATTETEPATVELPPETPLAFSVVIASFSSLDDALTRKRRWSDRETQFYVAPTVVRGVVYYRVFAGLLPERGAARELADELVDRGIKESTSAWDVRPTSLAFHFGTYDDRREASSTVDTLEGRGVPAYMVAAAAAPGTEAYHVYAGGYEKPDEATPLRQQIEEAGFEAELVERVGMPTQ